MTKSKIYKVEAVVLKRFNTGEGDRIVTLFTKYHGKIKAMAKGVRKISSRRAPHLEQFRHIRASLYKGRNIDTITEVVSLQDQPIHTRSLKTISYAFYICEMVDMLTRDQRIQKNFQATTLKDGNVLITGGSPYEGLVIKKASIYIPE